MQLVADGGADAVVFDTPVLAYRIDNDLQGQLQLSGGQFAPDPHGIALTTGSDLREPINAVLLELTSDGTLNDLNERWLGIER